jgi:hypothetical protein
MHFPIKCRGSWTSYKVCRLAGLVVVALQREPRKPLQKADLALLPFMFRNVLSWIHWKMVRWHIKGCIIDILQSVHQSQPKLSRDDFASLFHQRYEMIDLWLLQSQLSTTVMLYLNLTWYYWDFDGKPLSRMQIWSSKNSCSNYPPHTRPCMKMRDVPVNILLRRNASISFQ